MIEYENEEQAILQSMKYDRSRGWIRRQAKKDDWDYERIRTFDYGGHFVENEIREAIYMGFLSPLDDISGETLLEKWEKVVDTIMEVSND